MDNYDDFPIPLSISKHLLQTHRKKNVAINLSRFLLQFLWSRFPDS